GARRAGPRGARGCRGTRSRRPLLHDGVVVPAGELCRRGAGFAFPVHVAPGGELLGPDRDWGAAAVPRRRRDDPGRALFPERSARGSDHGPTKTSARAPTGPRRCDKRAAPTALRAVLWSGSRARRAIGTIPLGWAAGGVSALRASRGWCHED